MRNALIITATALLAASPALAAEPTRNAPPAVVKSLLDCRAIADATQRLACLDAGVAALAGAVEKRDVVVTDREQVNKARRGLFGLAPSGLKLFGGSSDDRKGEDRRAEKDADDEDRVPDAIEATITAVGASADGKWRLTLDDGSRWVQTEAKTMRRDPRPGMKIRIRTAAMGGYFANVDGQLAIRVKRVN
jgi:hypothetical protein